MTERWIYIIRPVGQLGPVKIGISARPSHRLSELLEWSPVDLEIVHQMPGNYGLERDIQQAFGGDHIRREWFHPTQRIIDFVAALQSGTPVEQAVDLTRKEGLPTDRRHRTNAPKRGRVILQGVGLTGAQLDCLNFIRDHKAEHGRVPTYQEIADGMGLRSKSGAHRHVLALEERGRLTRVPFRSGGFDLVNDQLGERAAA